MHVLTLAIQTRDMSCKQSENYCKLIIQGDNKEKIKMKTFSIAKAY